MMFVEKHDSDANGNNVYRRVAMENRVSKSKTIGWSGEGDRIHFGLGEMGSIYV